MFLRESFLFLQEYFDKILNPLGFEGLQTGGKIKRELGYTRCLVNGSQRITFSIHEYGGKVFLDLHVGFRHHVVEDLFHRFTSGIQGVFPGLQTLVVSFGMLTGKPFQKLQAEDMDQLEECAQFFEGFLARKGLPFLEKNSNLSTIDWLINEQPHVPTPYTDNQAHRCFKGAVIARLTNNPQFEFITQAYEEQLSIDPDAEILLARFHKMLGLIRAISMN